VICWIPCVQSSRLAVFGGLGMSFNICRGTLVSLAMFPAIRNARLVPREELAATAIRAQEPRNVTDIASDNRTNLTIYGGDEAV
jgi:hypothetical protein